MAQATHALVRLTIITQNDEVHEIETPLDLRASEFVDELRQALGLATNDAEGRPIAWQLDNKDTGKRLIGDKTLEQNGVENGHRLNLWRTIVAGGDPPALPN